MQEDALAEQYLLLVAPRQGVDRGVDRRHTDVETGQLLADQAPFLGSLDKAQPGDLGVVGGGDVLPDRTAHEKAFVAPVGGEEGDPVPDGLKGRAEMGITAFEQSSPPLGRRSPATTRAMVVAPESMSPARPRIFPRSHGEVDGGEVGPMRKAAYLADHLGVRRGEHPGGKLTSTGRPSMAVARLWLVSAPAGAVRTSFPSRSTDTSSAMARTSSSA